MKYMYFLDFISRFLFKNVFHQELYEHVGLFLSACPSLLQKKVKSDLVKDSDSVKA